MCLARRPPRAAGHLLASRSDQIRSASVNCGSCTIPNACPNANIISGRGVRACKLRIHNARVNWAHCRRLLVLLQSESWGHPTTCFSGISCGRPPPTFRLAIGVYPGAALCTFFIASPVPPPPLSVFLPPLKKRPFVGPLSPLNGSTFSPRLSPGLLKGLGTFDPHVFEDEDEEAAEVS